jgi:hypothetical protein
LKGQLQKYGNNQEEKLMDLFVLVEQGEQLLDAQIISNLSIQIYKLMWLIRSIQLYTIS